MRYSSVSLALLGVLLVGLLPVAGWRIPSAAAAQDPQLEYVSVSRAGAGNPEGAPVVLFRGGEFLGWYFVTNNESSAINVGLGLAVRPPSGRIIPGGETGCSVPASTRIYACSRSFVLPNDAEAGSYNVLFGLSYGGNRLLETEKLGWLTVTARATLTLSSSTTDGKSNLGEIGFKGVRYPLPTSFPLEAVNAVDTVMYPPQIGRAHV